MLRFTFALLAAGLLAGCGLTITASVDGGGGLDAAPPDGGSPGADAGAADGGDGEPCGAVTCAPGLECCNPSCGVCVEPGGGCAAIECVDAGMNTTCAGLACGSGEICCADCDGARSCTPGPSCPDILCETPCSDPSDCDAGEYCAPDPTSAACGEGTCAPRPTACPDDCPGACGCDGVTYCNECGAKASGAGFASSGPCARPATCAPMDAHSVADCATVVGVAWNGTTCENVDCVCEGADCGRLFRSERECYLAYGECICGGFAGVTCRDWEFCDYPSGCGFADGTGVCRPRPMGCAGVVEPVCG